ncbi:MAG: phosphate ABC transporter permease PstA, partial [Erysipelotrichaceae bacterium]
NGIGMINLDLLTSNYWSENFLGSVDATVISEFENTGDYEKFSTKWGVALTDYVNASSAQQVVIEYIDPDSPFQYIVSLTAGEGLGSHIALDEGYVIEKVDYKDEEGTAAIAGTMLKQDAATVIEKIDEASIITSMYIKTQGGGIKGSLITTLYLILISLCIALPVGIMSAIYLNEYASKSPFNRLIRRGIETLTGVPSIVYGLMGVTVLFPVTQMFGATTTSILLGALTMSVILLPTIIKSTEEALLVVPQGLRDGSLSLGATKSQTIFKVVLPCCINGILTGVLLSIGRVIGESAALVYTMGTFINDSPSILSQGTSLSLMIWSFMSGEQPNYELACAISLIILAVVFVLNLTVKFVGKKLTKSFN